MEPLRDAFGRTHRYLRLSVTDRCNLRCIYCMPAAGIVQHDRAEILSFDEITRLARVFATLGVRKIRLTGGEPLVRQGIIDLATKLAALPGVETLALTTNGVLLEECAGKLKATGVQRLNISLDTLRPERFERITRHPLHDRVLAGVDAALAAGFVPLRINVVVMGGVNDDELLDFVAFSRERPVQVRFIEYMPFRSNGWEDAGFVPYGVMRRAIETRHPLEPVNDGDETAGRVAREFKVDGHMGTVGFITPISEHFCGGCNRLRLTADGALKSCLFTPPEASLRDRMRAGASDMELIQCIRTVLGSKHATHPSLEELAALRHVNMHEIGG